MDKCMNQLLVILLSLVSFSSLACSCPTFTEEENFNNAVEVLYVQVLSTEYNAGAKPFQEVRATYKILEAFKQSENSEGYVTEGLGMCSVGLMSGHQYILYISKNRQTTRCIGSLFYLDGDIGIKALEKLRGKKSI